MKKPSSYAVIGAGGRYCGSLLQRSGKDVHFLLHSDYDRVKHHGWRIEMLCEELSFLSDGHR
ncbi:MAG: 2-dehydropantoate 2-reductase N-terminal domain-containing protein [Deltaproteobacteria bacterium]|nr:2-dehydropantoate 2-reductase N-terminal domain-containing protein [Deltaproteobacteria bacterium]